MSEHSCRFNFPLIYHQELTASKYNLAALIQSLCPGAETQPWVVYLFGRFTLVFVFCFVCFPVAAVFCERFVLIVFFPK